MQKQEDFWIRMRGPSEKIHAGTISIESKNVRTGGMTVVG